MPFGKYKDFDDCVKQNQDKENPGAYCAAIKKKIEGIEDKDLKVLANIENQQLFDELIYNGIDFKRIGLSDNAMKGKYKASDLIYVMKFFDVKKEIAIEMVSSKGILKLFFERKETKFSASPYWGTTTEEISAPFDEQTEVEKAGINDLEKMSAWYDSNNPDIKSSYKLIHHKAGGEFKVNWNGVKQAMKVLLSMKAGSDISYYDKKGVYDHLFGHYNQFSQPTPELREYSVEELNVFDEDNGTADLKNVEIFAIGTWHGKLYENKDLNEIVDNFNALKGKLKPPFKLGHSNALAIKDGMPAIGWIQNLKAEAGKLIADISDVPKKVYDLIKKKAYKEISSEIYLNVKDKISNKLLGKVLGGVALLGADIPEVKGLASVQALYDENFETIVFNREDLEKELNLTKGDEKEMEKLEELQKQVEQLTSQVTTLTTERDTLKKKADDAEVKLQASEKKVSELTEKEKTQLSEKRKAEIEVFIEAKKKEGKILPKNEAKIRAILMANPEIVKFSEDGKDVEMSANDALMKIIDGLPKISFEENSRGAGGEKGDQSVSRGTKIELSEKDVEDGVTVTNEDLTEKAFQYAEANKVSFEVALIAVSPRKAE